jgi:hypothetical protein
MADATIHKWLSSNQIAFNSASDEIIFNINKKVQIMK